MQQLSPSLHIHFSVDRRGVCPELTPFSLITSLHCRAAPSNKTACRFQGNERGQSLSTSDAFSIVWVYCVSWPPHIYIQSTGLGRSVWESASGILPAMSTYVNAAIFFPCADAGHFLHSDWVSNQWETSHVCLFVWAYVWVCVVEALQVMRTRPTAVS